MKKVAKAVTHTVLIAGTMHVVVHFESMFVDVLKHSYVDYAADYLFEHTIDLSVDVVRVFVVTK